MLTIDHLTKHYKGSNKGVTDICLEIEDKAFEKSKEDVHNSLLLSKHYIENYIIG